MTMNKSIIFIAPALLAASSVMMLSGCSSEELSLGQGDGAITVRAALSSDVKVVSRADADDLRALYGESLQLWLTKPGSGPVRRYEGIDNVPVDPVVLPSGAYVAEAWAGDSVSASFDSKYFKGFEPFDVTAGSTTPVSITLRIANVVVSVDVDESVDNVIREGFTLTAGHSRGELTFEGRDERKGYFMMPSSDTDLTLTFAGQTLDGKDYTQTETIANAAPTTEYVIHIKHNPKSENGIGGAFLDITVDATEIEVNDELVLTLAPDIRGMGFDIAQPQLTEEGKGIRRSVYISAADELSSLILDSEALTSVIGRRSVDLVNAADDSYEQLLNQSGITVQRVVTDGVLTAMRVSFEEEYVAALPEGVFTYRFAAADGELKSEAALTIEVSNAPVAMNPVNETEVDYTSAVLRATILKDDMSRAGGNGFRYRAVGESAWTFVEGVVADGEMTATVTGLKNATVYEATAFYSTYETDPVTFTTKAYPQLPNASFEDFTDATPMLFYSGDESNMFWDSGNHGSKTMGKNVTEVDKTIKHSGKQSVKLMSQFVGMGSLGKFAAGNIFVGKYLKTDGTDGELGWGREFNFIARPKAIRVYAKYTPGACQSNVVSKAYKNPEGWTAGTMDQGIIYAALMSDDTVGYSDGSQWSCVVKTKSSQLFDSQAANVVAYGQRIFTEATPEEGLMQIDIPLDDVHGNLDPKRIIIVASASRFGDYFLGGQGSTLWLDDFELIY